MEENKDIKVKSNMTSTYGDDKLSKNKELNSEMSISESGRDEYTNTIHDLRR